MHNEHISFLRNDASSVSVIHTEFINILIFILAGSIFMLPAKMDRPVHICLASQTDVLH